MSPAKKSASKMSAEHKAALAEGRAQGRVIREYLEALEAHKPKRGRKRTPDSVKKRLDKIAAELETADPMKRLHLIQERIDLERELATRDDLVDLAALEKEFTKVAKAYSARKGISYSAWRELGVSPATLKAAGITRSG
ncbi:MAG: hypothetical protein N2037_13005 [Acidimicrobiales bacterium]|nr:hypothetical protein [Acidimicrobiales bacterium]